MQLNIPGYTLNHTPNLSIDGTGAVHTLVKNIYIMVVLSSNDFINNELFTSIMNVLLSRSSENVNKSVGSKIYIQ